MRSRKLLIVAVAVSALLGATIWAQAPFGKGMQGDSTRGQSYMGSSRDSLSHDSATNHNGVTASDQNNDKGDVDITARIRREIMATKGMSVNAQNVKIVTINGKVTLRGEVNSTNEKEAIGQIANNVATSKKVTNALQVK